MMNKKKLHEDVMLVRNKVLQAIPTGVSFTTILMALAEVIKVIVEQQAEAE